MEKFRRSEEAGVAGIYPTESELLSEWLPYCSSSIISTLKPVPAENLCSSSSSSSSSSSDRSSTSPASCSSGSFSTLSEDLYDLDKEFPDSWLGLKTEQSRTHSDEEFYRLCSGADLGLMSGDSYSPLEFFSDYSVVSSPHEGLVDPGCFDGASLSSSSGFVSMTNSTFDDFSIPTCVEDIGASDALLWSNDDEGSNGYESVDEKLLSLLSDDDEYSFEVPSSGGAVLGSSSSANRAKAAPAGHRRRPGRPRKEAGVVKKENPSSSNIESQDQRSKRRRKQHPWKGHHLWEFIRELLENNDEGVGEGEQLVRWENREKGVFLIVNSKEVAELWGKRKRNDTMTYEKLSRSLRWCRTSGFLAEVPKDRKYPKKLCFCFGHRAYDIHRTTTTTTTTTMDATTNE